MEIDTDPSLATIFKHVYYDNRILDRIILEIVLPLKNREYYINKKLSLPHGALFYGPPGTGKKTLAYLLKQALNCSIIEFSGADIIGQGVGKAEFSLLNKFETARKKAIPIEGAQIGLSILLIKDIDTIAVRRNSLQGNLTASLTAIMIAEIDRLRQLEPSEGNVFVIATASKIENVDPGLRIVGRLEMEFFIGAPPVEGREHILSVFLSNFKSDPDISISKIAQETPGYTASDLFALTSLMAQNALLRNLGSTKSIFNQSLSKLHLQDNFEINLTLSDLKLAKQRITPSGLRDNSFEIPTISLEDVYGLKKQKAIIYDNIISYIKNKRSYLVLGLKPIKGIIFYGPPGTGKTMLAKAIANSVEWNFLLISGPELLSKFVGESEENIRLIFHKARQYAPCVIFFDELDSIAPRRDKSQDTHVYASVVGQILSELDGVRALEDVIIIGATNRIDLVDPALLREGRLDFKLEIPLPVYEDRIEFITNEIKKKEKFLSPGFAIDEVVHELVAKTEGLSGASLSFLLAQAARHALKRQNYSINSQLSKDDYYEVLREYQDNKLAV